MKAVVVRRTGPASEVLRLETIADPTPSPGEAVIAVAACGVCFHDVVTRAGTLKAGVEMPMIPGHEIAGTAFEIGRNVAVSVGSVVFENPLFQLIQRISTKPDPEMTPVSAESSTYYFLVYSLPPAADCAPARA